MQRPNAAVQMTTACRLISPTGTKKVNGVEVKLWPTAAEEETAGNLFFANIKAYGGSERVQNDLLVIEDTVVLTTWYRPDILANCRVRILGTGALYEIINQPESWDMRNQFLVCKLRRVRGNG